jgi:hypothetical protein
MKSQRVQRFPAFLFFSFLAFASSAQETAPTIVCPTTPVEFLDVTNNDPAFWNAPYWWDASIQSHDIGDAAAPLEISATNHCSSGNLTFHFQLKLDLDGDRFFETTVKSDQVSGTNTVTVDKPNTFAVNRAFDFRSVPNNQKWGFALKVLPEDANHTQKALVVWRDNLGNETTPLIPYGSHQIKWTVKDNCGQTATCTQRFVVRDAAPPEVTCKTALSATLNYTNTVNVWAEDLLLSATDNYTPAHLLKLAIRKSNTGTGLPDQPAILYTCEEQGIQSADLWVRDKAGNTIFCAAEMQVLMGNFPCVPTTPPMFRVCFKTENNHSIDDVEIELQSTSLPPFSLPLQQTPDGCLDLNLIPFVTMEIYQAIPSKDIDQLSGVSTWDLVLMNNYILNLELLDSPYKLIAADVDRNGVINPQDIVELRKLILGTYTSLPNNGSWRFIDEAQEFTDPRNPFLDVFVESFPAFYHTNPTIFHRFIGVKIGDVDNTVASNNLLNTDDRAAMTAADFNITRKEGNNWLVDAGETVELAFDNSTTAAYQMTLETNGLKTTEILPGAGISVDNFGQFEGAVTMAFEQGSAPFSIRFTAEKSGDLREMISVSSRITPAMAFGEIGEKRPINLQFTGEKSSSSPNPWTDHTRISFHTSAPTTAALKVVDGTGRLLYTTSAAVGKGAQSFELKADQVPLTGILFYEITTDNGVFSGKMNKQ